MRRRGAGAGAGGAGAGGAGAGGAGAGAAAPLDDEFDLGAAPAALPRGSRKRRRGDDASAAGAGAAADAHGGGDGGNDGGGGGDDDHGAFDDAYEYDGEGGALVPYIGGDDGAEGDVDGGAGGGAGGGGVLSLLEAMPARPVAITKYGYRQFVETDQGVRLFLQNCVASCDLRCAPDLAKIATHARNAEFNPQRFAAVILRMREPKATALIFASGKMVVTGTKNEEDALLAARTVGKILLKLGFACAVAGFKIQNIVATGDCGFPIRLEGLADEHSKFSSYEPELFPGLIYRMEQPRIVLLVFVSGKVVITGAKTRSMVIEGATKLYPLLFKYRKAPSSAAAAGAGAGAAAGGAGAGAAAGAAAAAGGAPGL